MKGVRTLPSTYRFQLRPGFGFAEAAGWTGYLKQLGVGTIYLSPILAARTGSPHGYDVTDASRIREELGGERGFAALSESSKRAGLKLLLDVVPNHMAASGENPWWRDVLENGRFSPYADWFDIDWEGEGRGARKRLLLPILGDDLRSVLERGELGLALDDDGIHLRYYEARLPLAVGSYGIVLAEALSYLPKRERTSRAAIDLSRLIARIERLGDRSEREWKIARDPKAADRIASEKRAIRKNLLAARAAHPEIRSALQRIARKASGEKGGALRERLFERLLARQHYRLVFWKRAAAEINYRRFFNVADLVALRIERPAVFAARHAMLTRLLREGAIDGLRVDHVDGLVDPEEYLVRLRRRAGARRPIVVEKILAEGERLPPAWPVDGTTGYEFAAAVAGALVDPVGFRALRGTWKRVTGDAAGFAEMTFRKKRQVAAMHFAGETRALALRLRDFAAAQGDDPPPLEELEGAVRTILAAFPVYRTYARGAPIAASNRSIVGRAIRDGRKADPAVSRPALRLVQKALLFEGVSRKNHAARREAERFVQGFQSLSAPVFAKGVEDSTFYAYAPLAALNEVGGGASVPRDGVAAFHAAMRRRLKEMPLSLNATATHDTKRGEDVRARLYVLSELARAWDSLLPRWMRLNKVHRTKVENVEVPTPAEEALYYQTLLGAWPSSGGATPVFRKRIRDYVLKAAREAKEGTSWLTPNAEHEEALARFVDRTLRTAGANPFLRDLESFQTGLSRCGAWNGLAQTLLKIAAPGVPDVYQGSELWDLRLVDPDNRRPVDFERRRSMLEELATRARRDRTSVVSDLVRHWEDGRIKLFLLAEGLTFRRRNEPLFSRGEYLAMRASSSHARHVLAFARRLGTDWALAVVPRLVAPFCVNGRPPVGGVVWGEASLVLPPGAPETYANVLTGERLRAEKSGRSRILPLRDVFETFPVALLAAETSMS